MPDYDSTVAEWPPETIPFDPILTPPQMLEILGPTVAAVFVHL